MIVDLNGRWELQREGDQSSIPAMVPGCAFTDLLAAGEIPDPFLDDNEDGVQWVARENWIYRRAFNLPAAALGHSRILLCCEGLDTVASIRLNGKLLGTTDNMFRQWEFDARRLLIEGKNEIEIRFTSPLDYIAERQKLRPLHYPTAPHQIPGFSQIRKAAFSFGWDWGPCLPTSGIWRPIYLRAFDTGRLLDVSIRQDHVDAPRVKLSVGIRTESSSSVTMSARVTLKYGSDVIDCGSCPIEGSEGIVELCVEAPHLWWPRGMGEQALYEIAVELVDEDSRVLDFRKRRVGLRTLRLERGPDQWGSAFSFIANGIPFFAKGSNWIPADALVTRVTPDILRQRLSDAAEANMNMIRVWGGGIYEPDEFYDLCDELGLCVWQDFMFACAPYPLDVPEFVQNAEVEIRQQIQRLHHHACLALWCGNNELEMCGFVAEKADAGHMALADYQSFFSGLIPSFVAELDPDHDYWPGSPYKEAGESYNPDVWIDNPNIGDAHIWSVWHLKKPFEEYRNCKHRFVSEFGFQSFPAPDTVSRFIHPDARSIDSPQVLHHQRSGNGNALIMEYLLDWFRPPCDFESTLWCSQLLQGVALKIACEHWRRSMPRTMGTLIWQLNDAWPGASWSTIDYFGEWKAAHYLARRFYAPLLVSAVEDIAAGCVAIHVTNDHPDVAHCELHWNLTDPEGCVLGHEKIPLIAEPMASSEVAHLDLCREIEQHGRQNLLLWLELRCGGRKVSENLILFAKPAKIEFRDPGLKHSVAKVGDQTFHVTLIVQKPALWVWVELPGSNLRCSDNFVHLQPETPLEITINTNTPTSAIALESKLKVRSLFHTYTNPDL
jgi:beta-mannosidase